MSDSRTPEHNAPPEADGPKLGRWQKLLLGLAVLLMVVGFALKAGGGGSGGDTAAPTVNQNGMGAQGGGAGGSSLVGDGTGGFQLPGIDKPEPGEGGASGEPAAGDEGLTSWSPMLIKGGFSFAFAFAVGYALRTFLKVATFFVGALGLALFAMSYWGGVDLSPMIDTMGGWWDQFAGKVSSEAGEFKKFMTGSLPSAGAGGLGLISGFKKG